MSHPDLAGARECTASSSRVPVEHVEHAEIRELVDFTSLWVNTRNRRRLGKWRQVRLCAIVDVLPEVPDPKLYRRSARGGRDEQRTGPDEPATVLVQARPMNMANIPPSDGAL
jgi:hypothetical protein